jgi:tetratricopeptide (TPR) repeat protein
LLAYRRLFATQDQPGNKATRRKTARSPTQTPEQPTTALLKQRAGTQYRETMASYLKSLQIKRDILGPDHLSVGKTLNNIGSVFYLKREFEPAMAAYKEACRIMTAKLGSEHLDVGTVICNIGDVYCATGITAEALDTERHCRFGGRTKDHDPKVTGWANIVARNGRLQKEEDHLSTARRKLWRKTNNGI